MFQFCQNIFKDISEKIPNENVLFESLWGVKSQKDLKQQLNPKNC